MERDERVNGLSVCVDIGGTFTDVVLMNGEGAVLASEKVFTTSEDLASGAIEGVRRLLARSGADPAAVGEVVHATTQTSNTVIERTGARTALITTAGFRDILELGRESRYDVYDLFIDLPAPLVPRRYRLEIDERLDAGGRVVRSPDPTRVHELACHLMEEGVEAAAVCLLHAYRNPVHERAVRDALRDGGFEGPIVLFERRLSRDPGVRTGRHHGHQRIRVPPDCRLSAYLRAAASRGGRRRLSQPVLVVWRAAYPGGGRAPPGRDA